MKANILIVGVGGQGTLLASRVLGALAEIEGSDCKLSEVHGMSQRGGSVVTHVKIAPEVASPIVGLGDADVILMIETYGCSNQVADHLGYYHRLISDNLSIYSRYPIVKTYTFPDSISTFNFGGVELDMNGKRVRVFDTWLHYLPDERLTPTEKSEQEILAWDDEGTRDEEVRRILDRQQVPYTDLQSHRVGLEDAFIGLTGKY